MSYGNAAFGQERFTGFFDFQDDYLHYRGHGTDRYYTGGISLGMAYRPKKKPRRIHVFSFNQRMYTPSDIMQTGSQPGDYPYQGLLFISFNQHRMLSAERIFSWGVSAGTTGPYAWAKEFQSEFHRWIGYKKPLGWDNAISLGHYLQAQASFRKSLFNSRWLGIGACGDAEFGTVFNRMGIAAEIRLGRQPMSFPEHTLFGLWQTTQKGVRIQSFAIPSLQLVLYNRLLEDGLQQDPADPDGLQAIEVSYLVGRLSTGIHVGLGRFSVIAVQHTNTREFYAAKSHRFGQVMFMYRW